LTENHLFSYIYQLADELLLLSTTANWRVKTMATQENSVQFSLKELVSLEANRRQEEETKKQQRSEEEAAHRAAEEAKARRRVVESEVKRAAEHATQQARVEAEKMLVAERARIFAEENRSTITLQPTPQRRSNAWMGFTALAFSVLGLGISLAYLAAQPNVASVRTIQPAISINRIETINAPVDLAVKEEVIRDEIKTVKRPDKTKVIKKTDEVKVTCDAKKDPLCGALFDEN
jgi:hypothetical protein